MANQIFTRGDRLPNGATVLQIHDFSAYGKNGVVLALTASGREFATWRIDSEGATYSGDYFVDIESAVTSYKRRIAAGRG